MYIVLMFYFVAFNDVSLQYLRINEVFKPEATQYHFAISEYSHFSPVSAWIICPGILSETSVK